MYISYCEDPNSTPPPIFNRSKGTLNFGLNLERLFGSKRNLSGYVNKALQTNWSLQNCVLCVPKTCSQANVLCVLKWSRANVS